jgi:hypothetical protein
MEQRFRLTCFGAKALKTDADSVSGLRMLCFDSMVVTDFPETP